MVEVLVVVAVLGVLMAIAVPRYSSLAEVIRLRNIAYQFTADVRYAQEVAQRDWTRSRILFGPDFYKVQVGKGQNPAANCTDSPEETGDYATIKRVSLGSVSATSHFWPDTCIVFERTGRIPWVTPSVVYVTPSGTSSRQAVLLDDDRVDHLGNQASMPPSNLPIVYWDTNLSGLTVDVIVDLGKPHMVDSVCVGVINFPARSDFKYPQKVFLYWSSSAPPSGNPINGVAWSELDEEEPNEQQNKWRTCPAFAEVSYKAAGWNGVSEPKPTPVPVQYLRFQFLRQVRYMGVDEVEVQPTVTFSAPGGATRRVTIIPATGSVTLVNN